MPHLRRESLRDERQSRHSIKMKGNFNKRPNEDLSSGYGIANITKIGTKNMSWAHDREETKTSFDRDGVNLRLEEQLKLHHLKKLEDLFENFEIPAPDESIPHYRRVVREPGCLNVDEFRLTIAKVLGTDDFNDQLDKLFSKLDTSGDGYVDWGEFCTYMLLQYRENDYMRTKKELPFRSEPKIRHSIHNRQETTTKILSIDNPTRYVSLSKEGAICVWDANHLYLMSNYTMVQDDEDPMGKKRRFKMWVTDAVFMPNCHKLAIATTSRDIRFYETATGNFFEEFHLYALPDVPNCLDYWYDTKNPNGDSFLMWGDDCGAISLITFFRPVSQLFETPFMETHGTLKIFVKDIHKHAKCMLYEYVPDVHPDVIKKVQYMPDNEHIISCTSSPKSSVVIWDVLRRKKTYIFKLTKGCETFDYNRQLNVLVTGSADHLVRLWNPYVPNKPMAILIGHQMGVIDVVIHEPFAQVFSYSRDGVIKVWDVKEHSCLQTVTLKFPSSFTGRLPEHGFFPCRLQPPPQNAFIVGSNDYLAMLKCGQVREVVSFLPTTHTTQLCCAIYNTYFKQVVTGSDDSTIAVWDIETGVKAIMFTNAHGDEEITCMSFDGSDRRLITGARNGTVKIWNFQTGHNLNKLEPVGDLEVTGIVPLAERRLILTVGWSRLLTKYDDADQDNMYIKADISWKEGQVHEEDITAVAFLPPNLLATGSFDGALVIWSTETEKVFFKLRKGQQSRMSRKLRELNVQCGSSRPGTRPSRPNSRHRASHSRPEQGEPVPIDKLLFLPGRVKSAKRNDGAILISSEAGVLRFWSVYGQKHDIGFFYAPDSADESVLAMCSNQSNSLLVVGDTQGLISVWNIENYCTEPLEETITERPPLMCWWRAHDSALVSVEFISHEDGEFVVSSSTDKTARLWNLKGHFVGTFGQKDRWNLKSKKSWTHPDTPWSILEQRGKYNIKTLKEDDKESRPATSGEGVDEENEDANVTEQKEEGEEEEETGGAREEKTVDEFSERPNMTAPDEPDIPQAASAAKSVRIAEEEDIDVEHEIENFRLKMRSHTIAYHGQGAREKTLLGFKVEKDFYRQKLGRMERREHFGGIDSKRTSRMGGKLCTAYHALSTPEVSRVNLPRNLPVTPRMASRGYTSTNINEDILKTMDLKYHYDASNDIFEETVLNAEKRTKLPAISNKKGQTKVTFSRNESTSKLTRGLTV
ncbi:WD repeat-containing protein on Y chromosome-like isoform X2 [Lineus longissimus]|uniref:WD repeat-containing protein on Y chromosome-like isoform X2 n=1 Tax=Lineus longissimus TaxID=88925 RepID=UPI002B4EB362